MRARQVRVPRVDGRVQEPAVEVRVERAGAEFTSDEVPVSPERLVSLIQETFPDSGIVT